LITLKDLSNKTLGIIHASIITTQAVKPYIEKIIPEVKIMHVVDDTIQRDNIAAGVGVIPKVNYYKFAQYAHNLEEAKVDLIMLACSTFNYAAELARPMINTPIVQIDRPMMEQAVQMGKRIGLLATLATTVPSSERLLKIAAAEAGKEIEINTVLCSEAFEEYEKGNTPNPCIACNRYVKWESLLQRSMEIGADYIATGHYARVVKLDNGRYTIKKSATQAKDQTYALYPALKHSILYGGKARKPW